MLFAKGDQLEGGLRGAVQVSGLDPDQQVDLSCISQTESALGERYSAQRRSARSNSASTPARSPSRQRHNARWVYSPAVGSLGMKNIASRARRRLGQRVGRSSSFPRAYPNSPRNQANIPKPKSLTGMKDCRGPVSCLGSTRPAVRRVEIGPHRVVRVQRHHGRKQVVVVKSPLHRGRQRSKSAAAFALTTPSAACARNARPSRTAISRRSRSGPAGELSVCDTA